MTLMWTEEYTPIIGTATGLGLRGEVPPRPAIMLYLFTVTVLTSGITITFSLMQRFNWSQRSKGYAVARYWCPASIEQAYIYASLIFLAICYTLASTIGCVNFCPDCLYAPSELA